MQHMSSDQSLDLPRDLACEVVVVLRGDRLHGGLERGQSIEHGGILRLRLAQLAAQQLLSLLHLGHAAEAPSLRGSSSLHSLGDRIAVSYTHLTLPTKA